MAFCLHCDEEVTAAEIQSGYAVEVNGGQDLMHRECLVRLSAGSAVHVREECEYYGGSKICHACEEGLTKREAARASFVAVRLRDCSPN